MILVASVPARSSRPTPRPRTERAIGATRSAPASGRRARVAARVPRPRLSPLRRRTEPTETRKCPGASGTGCRGACTIPSARGGERRGRRGGREARGRRKTPAAAFGPSRRSSSAPATLSRRCMSETSCPARLRRSSRRRRQLRRVADQKAPPGPPGEGYDHLGLERLRGFVDDEGVGRRHVRHDALARARERGKHELGVGDRLARVFVRPGAATRGGVQRVSRVTQRYLAAHAFLLFLAFAIASVHDVVKVPLQRL